MMACAASATSGGQPSLRGCSSPGWSYSTSGVSRHCRTKPADTYVIGLEASYESIRVNREVDMRVYGSALESSTGDQSVDLVLALLRRPPHHRHDRHRESAEPGEDAEGTWPGREAWRRAGDHGSQPVATGLARGAPVLEHRAHGRRLKLDMCFYPAHVYERVGRRMLPNAKFSVQGFQTSMLSTFPPAFSLPWLQVPRFMYPFDVNMYRWRFWASRCAVRTRADRDTPNALRPRLRRGRLRSRPDRFRGRQLPAS